MTIKHWQGLSRWLQLLLLAIIFIAGLLWFNAQQTQNSLALDHQQRDTQLQIAEDQRQETILTACIESISNMLLHDQLIGSKPQAMVQRVAQVRTLTALRQLNAARKGRLVRFLFDTKLINNDVNVISLSEVDLRNIDLRNANLQDTNLQGADLTGADLRGVDLTYATLQYTNLTGANLTGANLGGSDMHHTNLTATNLAKASLKDVLGITDQQLAQVKTLAGTTLPDGTVHP